MNQFRDLLMLALIVLALGLGLTDPNNWTWATIGGGYVVSGIHWLALTRPWSVVVLLALALALFMTRLKY